MIIPPGLIISNPESSLTVITGYLLNPGGITALPAVDPTFVTGAPAVQFPPSVQTSLLTPVHSVDA